MRKLIKRLCCLTIVLALVLSVAPKIELSFRVSAAENTDTPVRFPSGVASYEALCPVCKTTVTWKPYNGENDGDNPLKTSAHLYLDKDQTYPAGKSFLVAYNTTCVS